MMTRIMLFFAMTGIMDGIILAKRVKRASVLVYDGSTIVVKTMKSIEKIPHFGDNKKE